MAKNKNDKLKQEILARFPKGFKIKRESLPMRLVDGRERHSTNVSLLTATGNVWAQLTRNDYEHCLLDLEFHTRHNWTVMLGNLDSDEDRRFASMSRR